MNKKEGQLFVISAPSGTGKTTMLKKVMDLVTGLEFSISHTTRDKRDNEVNGGDYHFVSKEFFESKISENFFLEWATVHGNYYGTSKEAIKSQLEKGIDVILDIDVQGARLVRESGFSHSIQVFIAPPSMGELERRLRARGTESMDSIKTRLKNAEIEFRAVQEYPFLIVNDQLEYSVEMLKSIILSARAGNHRNIHGEPVNVWGTP